MNITSLLYANCNAMNYVIANTDKGYIEIDHDVSDSEIADYITAFNNGKELKPISDEAQFFDDLSIFNYWEIIA